MCRIIDPMPRNFHRLAPQQHLSSAVASHNVTMRWVYATLFLLLLCPTGFAQKLTYPEGYSVPRYMTDIEAAYLRRYGYPGGFRVDSPPVGDVRCVAEYEPMEGIIIAWEGDANTNTFQVGIVKGVTSAAGA